MQDLNNALTLASEMNKQTSISHCAKMNVDWLGYTGIPEVDEAAKDLRDALDTFDTTIERARVAINKVIEAKYSKED